MCAQRILLEDPDTGCVSCSDGESHSVIICRFRKDEHRVILPLWRPGDQPRKRARTFEQLLLWHRGAFSLPGEEPPRLSAELEWPDDKVAWKQSLDAFRP